MSCTLLRWFQKSPVPGSLIQPVDVSKVGPPDERSPDLGPRTSDGVENSASKDVRTALAPAKQGGEITLPIKRLWFERIAYGDKRVEFRDASPFWRGRLLGRTDLQRVRFLNGRSVDAPHMVCSLELVNVMAVGDIPLGLAPAPGSAAHRELFRDAKEVICLHLGKVLELHDPKCSQSSQLGKAPDLDNERKRALDVNDDDMHPRKCARL